MTVPEKLTALRAEMKTLGWAAFVVTGTDPHDSEYPPLRWETRSWVSGFTGSAGTVVVTTDKAGLWTDGRYFTQAEAELTASGIDLFKDGLPGTLSPTAWLSATLPGGSVVGVDGRTMTWAKVAKWREETAVAGLKVEAGADLLDKIWAGRPGLPQGQVWDYQEAVTGLVKRQDKATALRAALKPLGADAHLITALDDLAWLLNLRGSDIEYTPVFLGWGWVDSERTVLFVQQNLVEVGTAQALAKAGVEVRPYEALEEALPALASGRRTLVSPDRTNSYLVQILKGAGATVVEGASPLVMMKAKKTEAELELTREAHRRDGAALVEFLHWFDAEAPKFQLTETGAARKLDEFRAQRGGYRGPSFTAIPGFRSNGAVIHYHAHGEGAPLDGRGLFLLDTGAQYTQGTTDVTRTTVIGEPTAEEIEDYTLVLKAHVQIQILPFPVGTRGYMIDAFARRVLWKTGRNYNHGTGHGVGICLGVHETSARLSAEPNPTPLEVGMILSNEPGLYRPGQHGIRIENLVTVVPGGRTDFATFLAWDTLTLCPYERRLIDPAALEAEERTWIDDYHERVLREIGPLVSPPARKWLEAACARL
ncbi:MAG TPA: aminopeptidase P family protein [Spirochaetia bacterium]|nr:aminopeptidase P family protein [Spirochaetia bacterium]